MQVENYADRRSLIPAQGCFQPWVGMNGNSGPNSEGVSHANAFSVLLDLSDFLPRVEATLGST